MTQSEFVIQVVETLEKAGIPFMVTGSHGSSLHTQPRATQDLDLVIDPTSEQLERLLTNLGDRYYVSLEAARGALRRRSLFSLIDFEEGWKADLIIRKDRPFSIEEFQRRQDSAPARSANAVSLRRRRNPEQVGMEQGDSIGAADNGCLEYRACSGREARPGLPT